MSKTHEKTIDKLKTCDEIIWINAHKKPYVEAMEAIKAQFPEIPTLDMIKEADLRLKRFAPLFMKLFPETLDNSGIIESELRSIETFQKGIITFVGGRILGDWMVKLDSHLHIAGSIKARGGVYEVISFAEKLALEAGLLAVEDDYTLLSEAPAKQLFSQYTLSVGSTGNLGLSIGIMGKALGFNVIVHMSHDAKPWKIDLLRAKGATVILHEADYSIAVEEGRKSASNDPFGYFIDDENSIALFTGYAVAALRLKDQLDSQNRIVDENHPLFVYLPCGVGGAPGGIAYGLKLLYEDHVKIFFAEPTHSPCMLLGLASNRFDGISVAEIGLDNKTAADGLAVGRPSGFVGQVIAPLIEGLYTVDDNRLFWYLYMLSISENIKLEPSALAGFSGPVNMLYSTEGFTFLKKQGLLEKMSDALHISWATGGGLVPDEIMDGFIETGKKVTIAF